MNLLHEVLHEVFEKVLYSVYYQTRDEKQNAPFLKVPYYPQQKLKITNYELFKKVLYSVIN